MVLGFLFYFAVVVTLPPHRFRREPVTTHASELWGTSLARVPGGGRVAPATQPRIVPSVMRTPVHESFSRFKHIPHGTLRGGSHIVVRADLEAEVKKMIAEQLSVDL